MAPSSLPSIKKKKPRCDERPKRSVFMKRVPTLKKKAMELSTLCGVSVCLLCYDPDGDLHIWPENRDDVRQILIKFKGLSEKDKKKHILDLGGFLESERIKSQGKDKTNKKSAQKEHLKSEEMDPDLDEMINGYSDDKLRALVSRLDSKLVELTERMNNLVNSKERDQMEEARVYEIEGNNDDYQLVKSVDSYGQVGDWATNYQFPVGGFEVDGEFAGYDPSIEILGNGYGFCRDITESGYGTNEDGNYRGFVELDQMMNTCHNCHLLAPTEMEDDNDDNQSAKSVDIFGQLGDLVTNYQFSVGGFEVDEEFMGYDPSTEIPGNGYGFYRDITESDYGTNEYGSYRSFVELDQTMKTSQNSNLLAPNEIEGNNGDVFKSVDIFGKIEDSVMNDQFPVGGFEVDGEFMGHEPSIEILGPGYDLCRDITASGYGSKEDGNYSSFTGLDQMMNTLRGVLNNKEDDKMVQSETPIQEKIPLWL